uniref:Round spermatids protein STDP1 n=2 Tax=Mus TaxID=862507 RepID=Q66V79_MOUSE|nr:CDNA sequence AY702102 [Mus musculus]AAI17089.1 CDNA sequence AY702102 [Mus musculus]AAU08301.1 round spermatids protein STDP1 [Mus musculus]
MDTVFLPCHLPCGLNLPDTTFYPGIKARRDESTEESATMVPGLSVQNATATIRYLPSLSEDQTHPQMSHCSNSISRSDKLSLGRGHSSQQVQSALASRAGPFLFSVTHPEPLLSPHC